jgi:hypothetical protein
MIRLHWFAAVGALAFGLVAIGAAMTAAPSRAVGAAQVNARPQDDGAKAHGYDVDRLGRRVVAKDLFRFGRQAASTPYDPLSGAAVSPGASPVRTSPKPTLQVVGIVDGAEPQAVVEGLPGVNGARAVRVGDVIGGLTVQEIAAGVVRIAGLDTTWVLRVREPWKQ